MHAKPVTLFVPGKVLIQIKHQIFNTSSLFQRMTTGVTLRSPDSFILLPRTKILQTFLFLDLTNLTNTNFQQNSNQVEDEISLLQHQLKKSRGVSANKYIAVLQKSLTYIRRNKGPILNPVEHLFCKIKNLQFCTDGNLINRFEPLVFRFVNTLIPLHSSFLSKME